MVRISSSCSQVRSRLDLTSEHLPSTFSLTDELVLQDSGSPEKRPPPPGAPHLAVKKWAKTGQRMAELSPREKSDFGLPTEFCSAAPLYKNLCKNESLLSRRQKNERNSQIRAICPGKVRKI